MEKCYNNRTAGGVYTNNTGKSIEVSISSGNGATAIVGINKLFVDGVEIADAHFGADSGLQQQLFGKVENGSTYSIVGENGGPILYQIGRNLGN